MVIRLEFTANVKSCHDSHRPIIRTGFTLHVAEVDLRGFEMKFSLLSYRNNSNRLAKYFISRTPVNTDNTK